MSGFRPGGSLSVMNEDSDLLRLYADTGSEPAFAELVQRHVRLVYGVALRCVGGDAQLAEDVTQIVFTTLARKASPLKRHPALNAWLYVSAHHSAAALVRAEQRRRTRELNATAMRDESTPSSAGDELRPVLDQAMVDLPQDDRFAILLRFFEQQSFAQIGSRLRVSEEAARKRVDRALEKMRGVLEARGVTSSAASLGVALAGLSAAALPNELAAQVATHAVAHAASPASSVLAAGALQVLPVTAALVLGSWAVVSQSTTNRRLHAEIAAVPDVSTEIAEVKAENKELGYVVRSLEASAGTQAAAPQPTAAPAPARKTAAELTVSPEGTIAWNGTLISLDDFVENLAATSQSQPDGLLVLHADGARYDAIAYVVNEVRKAGVKHLVVQSNTKAHPHPTMPDWFLP